MDTKARRRRQAVRACVRRRATGFFAGTLCVATFFLVGSLIRDSLIALVGDTPFFVDTSSMMFAVFLIPQLVFGFRSARDDLLYCPKCQNYFGSVRAVYRLNKHQRCSGCNDTIEIAPVNKKQHQCDLVYMLGGLYGLGVVMWAVKWLIV